MGANSTSPVRSGFEKLAVDPGARAIEEEIDVVDAEIARRSFGDAGGVQVGAFDGEIFDDLLAGCRVDEEVDCGGVAGAQRGDDREVLQRDEAPTGLGLEPARAACERTEREL